MITKMKKLTFLVYHKEYEAFLNGVRELGVVHVAEKQQGVADNVELQDSIRLSCFCCPWTGSSGRSRCAAK